MAINQNPYLTFGQDMTPEQLAALKALIPADFQPGTETGSWRLGDRFGPTIGYQPAYEYINGDMQATGDGNWMISQPRNISSFGQSDVGGIWNPDGTWNNYNVDASNGRMVARVIASALGTAAAGGAFSGAEAGAAGAGADAGGLSGWDAAMADLANSGGITPEWMAASGAGNAAGNVAGNVADAGGGSGWDSAMQDLATSGGIKAADVVKGAGTASDLAKTLATVGGGIAGALDNKDKTTSSQVQPWEPAQPYLKGLLSEGAQLYDQYKQQPFNAAQKAGYTNLGGLLDLIGANAQGLLAGPQANASGANQFVRGRPQQGLMGSNFQFWGAPQAYGNFGVK